MGDGRSGARRSLPRRVARRLRRVAYGALGRTSFGTITSVSTKSPSVAITFDDGPDARWTPQVLDVLDSHGAKATFFVIGENVARHPDLVKRMHEAGHALGNHSQHHPSFPFIDRPRRLRELRDCEAALAPYPQARRLFRPPHLDQNLASRYDAWRLGYETIACNRHAHDWEDRTSDEMVHLLSETLGPGDIVMLHDSIFDRRDSSRAPMISALDVLLRRHATRLRFVTMHELLAIGTPRRELWLKQPNATRSRAIGRGVP